MLVTGYTAMSDHLKEIYGFRNLSTVTERCYAIHISGVSLNTLWAELELNCALCYVAQHSRLHLRLEPARTAAAAVQAQMTTVSMMLRSCTVFVTIFA